MPGRKRPGTRRKAVAARPSPAMSHAETYDLLVVGGGPAGLAAAAEAAALGCSVALADERPTLGGQIF